MKDRSLAAGVELEQSTEDRSVNVEELAKKATLLKWAVRGVVETARESAIEAEQLGPIDDLAGEIESELRALVSGGRR